MTRRPDKAVIFDLGNVLVTFDHDLCYQGLATRLQSTAPRVQAFIEETIRPRFDRGQMTASEVKAELETAFAGPLGRAEFHRTWADVFAPVNPMIKYLLSLVGRVRLELLSNTDAIHLPWCQERFGFFHCFDHLTLSYEVGAVKPDPVIYQAALASVDLPPDRCIYIDDIAVYVDAARAQGMCAVHNVDTESTIAAVEAWLGQLPDTP